MKGERQGSLPHTFRQRFDDEGTEIGVVRMRMVNVYIIYLM